MDLQMGRRNMKIVRQTLKQIGPIGIANRTIYPRNDSHMQFESQTIFFDLNHTFQTLNRTILITLPLTTPCWAVTGVYFTGTTSRKIAFPGFFFSLSHSKLAMFFSHTPPDYQALKLTSKKQTSLSLYYQPSLLRRRSLSPHIRWRCDTPRKN